MRFLIVLLVTLTTGCLSLWPVATTDWAASGTWIGTIKPVEAINVDGEKVTGVLFTINSGPSLHNRSSTTPDLLDEPTNSLQVILVDKHWKHLILWDKIPHGQRLKINGSWLSNWQAWGNRAPQIMQNFSGVLQCNEIGIAQ